MEVKYSYLDHQFSDIEPYLDQIRKVVRTGQFTLGPEVAEFEKHAAQACGATHAIGVGNGTDALILALKALGIGVGDEVITTSNTFVATVGAVAMVGARPVMVDVGSDYLIDPGLIERAITKKTKAIIPVHLTGYPCDMDPILNIAHRHSLHVVEDAAQAIQAEYKGKKAGSFGIAAEFSMHPLKNLNIWGDGGFITTSDDALAEKLRLWRNHGMKTRDEITFFAHNSRLDTIQASLALKLLKELPKITQVRQAHAALYDKELSELAPNVLVPPRRANAKGVYHTYIVQVEQRAELMAYLAQKSIETKIHYPIPIHLQEAAKYLGYRKGDLPETDKQADSILTLPNHQHLSDEQVIYVASAIKEFYAKK